MATVTTDSDSRPPRRRRDDDRPRDDRRELGHERRSSTDEQEPAEEPEPAEPEVTVINVKGGEPVDGVAKIKVKKGDEIADHGRRRRAPTTRTCTATTSRRTSAPAQKARFREKADLEGVYELELHDSGAQLATHHGGTVRRRALAGAGDRPAAPPRPRGAAAGTIFATWLVAPVPRPHTASSSAPTSPSPSGCSAGPRRPCSSSRSSCSPPSGPQPKLEERLVAAGQEPRPPRDHVDARRRSSTARSGRSSSASRSGPGSPACRPRRRTSRHVRLRDLLERARAGLPSCSATSSARSTRGGRRRSRSPGWRRRRPGSRCPPRSSTPQARLLARGDRPVPFAVLELVVDDGTMPRNVAIATLIYSVAHLGRDAALRHRRLARQGRGVLRLLQPVLADLAVRAPRRGARRAAPARRASRTSSRGRASSLFVAVMIGGVTFDGFKEGPVFTDWSVDLQDVLQGGPRRSSPKTSLELTNLLGLVFCVARDRRLLPARHRGGEERRRRLQRATELGRGVRPHARADRARLRGRALHDAAAVPVAGDGVSRLGPARPRVEPVRRPRLGHRLRHHRCDRDVVLAGRLRRAGPRARIDARARPGTGDV